MSHDITLAVDVQADATTAHRAIATTEGQRAFWTADAEVGPDEARFGFPKAPVGLTFTIDADEPGKLVRWICRGDFPGWDGSVVEWELVDPQGESGTGVILRHRGLGAQYDDGQQLGNVAHTWAMILDRLQSYLATGDPQPFFPAG